MEADFYSGKAVPSSGGGTTINNQDVTVTPSTSSQTLEVPEGYTGYGTISVNAVTSSIDNNIQAGNIKSGVTILGTEGTLQGTDTYQALINLKGIVEGLPQTDEPTDVAAATTILEEV